MKMKLNFHGIFLRSKRRRKAILSEGRLRREEARGIFAIATIATIIAVRSAIYNAQLPLLEAPIGPLLDLLLMPWGLYVFFMAVGISEDILPYAMARQCIQLAYLMFRTGLIWSGAIFGVLLLFRGVSWLMSLPPQTRTITILLLLLSFLSAFVLSLSTRLRKRMKESGIRKR